MLWLNIVIALAVAAPACFLSAKLSKHHWQRKARKREMQLQTKYAQQMNKLLETHAQQQQNVQAVQSAESIEEVSDALSDIYGGFRPDSE